MLFGFFIHALFTLNLFGDFDGFFLLKSSARTKTLHKRPMIDILKPFFNFVAPFFFKFFYRMPGRSGGYPTALPGINPKNRHVLE